MPASGDALEKVSGGGGCRRRDVKRANPSLFKFSLKSTHIPNNRFLKYTKSMISTMGTNMPVTDARPMPIILFCAYL